MDKKIVACIDGSSLSEAVCDYGAHLAKTLNLELKLLNTIEHPHKSQTQDLSGNIGLGSRDELLERLSTEESKESKESIQKGKEVLNSLRNRAIKDGAANVITSQRHGELYENLQEIKDSIRVLIIGLRGKEHESEKFSVGGQVEETIRSLHLPILIINGEYKPIKSVLIAYDGSESSKKALDAVAKTPLLGDVERHIVSVGKSESFTDSAREQLKSVSIDTKCASLSGEPIDALLGYQKEHNIDIIAMGAFSHMRIRSALFGSFTHRMLERSGVPLLLLR